MLNKKDIIAINQQFDDGILVNESSLDYAIGFSKRTNSWIKKLSHLVRAILIDHVFRDGNKRTTAAVIATYFEFNSYHYDPINISKLIIKILKKNITNIDEIERLIENVLK